ncbi:MAG: TonB-dependent receptor [Gemmatimonadota bacterium]
MTFHWHIRRTLRPGAALAVVALCVVGAAPAFGQSSGGARDIDGVVIDAETSAPLAGATVRVSSSGVGAVTASDGTFRLLRVQQGTQSLVVERLGYATVTQEVTVGDGATIRIEMVTSALDIGGFVVTGALSERGADESLRPVSVLAGQALQERLKATVAGTLASEPGFVASTMGPAAARPVIRGMGGDRVLLLEDGARVADVSNTHADHATAVDPASARRLEVVRGPAALLYGSNALGGVVNVIRDEIPSAVPYQPTGMATAQARTVDEGYGLSAHALVGVSDRLAVRVEGTGRTSSDLSTPAGNLLNTWADTWEASAGTSLVDDWGFVGGAVRAYRSDYGVPGGFVGGHESGVRIEMERTAAKFRTQIDRPVGPFQSVRVDGAFSDYQHREIETGEILGTIFDRALGSGDVIARHEGLGPFSAGALGARGSWEELEFRGALQTPNSRRYSAAAFLLEELEFGAIRVEAGLRYDWVRITPGADDPTSSIGNVRTRTFHSGSGSLGLLYGFGNGFALGASAAQAFRPPDVGELFSEGPHLAVYAYEVGNPELGTEVGRGFDAFVRYGSDQVEAEFTGFYNDVSGYVYGENTGRISRVQLPIYQYQANDAVLTGFEGSLHWQFAPRFEFEGTGSYVRGTLSGTDEPLPLIPPLQGRAAVSYDGTVWFAGSEAELAAEQNRLGEFEEATSGYVVFHLHGGVRLTLGGRLHVLTLNLENLSDKVYRNHLSRVKSIMPEAGRGVRLAYRVVF